MSKLEQKRKIINHLLEEGHRKNPQRSVFDLLVDDFIALKEHWIDSEKEIEGLQSELSQVKNAILLHKLTIWGPRQVGFKEDAALYEVIK